MQARQILWFVAIWAASVAVLAVLSGVIRWLLLG
jgi:hypothetical protein